MKLKANGSEQTEEDGEIMTDEEENKCGKTFKVK